MELSDYGMHLLRERYLMEGEETWEDLIERVAKHAAPDDLERECRYLDHIGDGRFIPSRMVYMGCERAFCSSCFVLGPIEDSRASIFDIVKDVAEVQSFGGGSGLDFSRIRPEGALISTTRGRASGPGSFMKLYNAVTLAILRAGRKGGAQMAVLRVDHPDILKFIAIKDAETDMINFNISVAITDAFMKAVEDDAPWDLVFNGKVYQTLQARSLFRAIAERAWKNGEPGVIFIDTVNRLNLFPEKIDACNPCGEQFVPCNVSCNLGSVNLANWDGRSETLREVVRTGVYFLNDSLNHAWWPLPKVAEKTLRYRNIGLGIMGYADLLIRRGIPYGSPEGLEFAYSLSREFEAYANEAADDYAAETGLPRNVTVTSIAPTGSIATLAGCSYSIEPIFGLTFIKNTVLGMETCVNKDFERVAREHGFYSDVLMERVKQSGSVQGDPDVPEDVQAIFRTANEIPWAEHVMVQAAWQKSIDNGLSKTTNLPNSATIEDVEDVYKLAYRLGCKSTTVYRDRSREVQAVTIGTETEVKSLTEIGLQLHVPEVSVEDPAFCVECSL